MSEKCFCWFNGFKVKDADARQMVENLSTIKETNNGYPICFWVGTQAQYDEIEEPAGNCMYIITDDTSAEEMIAYMQSLVSTSENNMKNLISTSENNMKKIDVSEHISFEVDTENEEVTITDSVVHVGYAFYSPIVDAVFFRIQVQFGITGGWNKGSIITIKKMGKYPVAERTGLFVYSDRIGSSACSAIINEDETIDITANEDITMGAWLQISGYYLCNGEV